VRISNGLITSRMWKYLILAHNSFRLGVVRKGAARTRAPAATNYDVYASRRKILESPGPKCNEASSSRPSAFWIMDAPRPGKWTLSRHLRAIFLHSLFRPCQHYGFFKSLPYFFSEYEVNRVEQNSARASVSQSHSIPTLAFNQHSKTLRSKFRSWTSFPHLYQGWCRKQQNSSREHRSQHWVVSGLIVFPRQTVGLWIRHVGCRLGPSVIPRGIVYLYFAAVFGFIQRHTFNLSCLGSYSVHLCDTQQYVWDNISRPHRRCFLWEAEFGPVQVNKLCVTHRN